ncbi:hypothetical protein BpHYR1_010181 [Brachionus plicatilis]|uniref:Uncharacterized protein n=1 Tax=Brachionus plicatilis TaxID=10195 RepID=A0A3M7QF06_BRAPC|nr:hypothetical protein BpHYR1_010181 [Brachionus plicatilis]
MNLMITPINLWKLYEDLKLGLVDRLESHLFEIPMSNSKLVLITGYRFKPVLIAGYKFKPVLITGYRFKHVLITGY